MVAAPSAASAFAMAAPMPLDAPVTTATLPVSLFDFAFIRIIRRGWSMFPVHMSRAPSAAAQEVHVRTNVRKRIARGVDAVNSGDRIKNDFPPLRRLIIHSGRQGDGAEQNFLPVIRPGRAGVLDIIVRLRQLHEDTEFDRFLGEPRADFIEQKVRRLPGCILIGKVFDAGRGANAKPSMTADSVPIREFERCDREKCFPRKTSWDGL